jgi:hypothetical protein
MAGTELAAYRTAAKAEGQEDPLPGRITAVVRFVRGKAAACEKNTLGPAGTIPDEVLDDAIAIIRLRLINRVGATVSDERKTAAKEALTTMRELARCEIAIEQPEMPSEEVTASGGIEVARQRCRLTGRDNLKGL